MTNSANNYRDKTLTLIDHTGKPQNRTRSKQATQDKLNERCKRGRGGSASDLASGGEAEAGGEGGAGGPAEEAEEGGEGARASVE